LLRGEYESISLILNRILKKMFDTDHARRGFTSPEGKTGLSRHQKGSLSPDEHQTSQFQENLHGIPSYVFPSGESGEEAGDP
jgi:hypothetical protein